MIKVESEEKTKDVQMKFLEVERKTRENDKDRKRGVTLHKEVLWRPAWPTLWLKLLMIILRLNFMTTQVLL